MVATPKLKNTKLSPSKAIRRNSLINPPINSSFLSDFKLDNHIKKIDTNVDLGPEFNDCELNPKKIDMPDSKSVNVKKKEWNIFKDINSIEPSLKTKNKDEDLPIQEGIETFKKKEDE